MSSGWVTICSRRYLMRSCIDVSSSRGELDALLLAETPHRVGDTGAVLHEVLEALRVDLHFGSLEHRMIDAEDLDESPIPGGPAVGDHDAVLGQLLAPHPRQTNRHCHRE